jgi:hypothetical protein
MKTAYIAYADWEAGVYISPKAYRTKDEAKAGLEELLREIAEGWEVTYLSPDNPKRSIFEDDLLDAAGTLHFGVQKVKLDWM